MTLAGGLLVKEQDPVKADVIIVLGGDGYGSRILKGAELEREEFAPQVWVSGGVGPLENEADVAVRYAVKKGFPEAAFHPVYLPPEADSTRGEAQFIGRKLKAAGVHSILLVTSNYHTRRSDYLWHNENPWLKITVVGAPDPYFSANGWWKTRAGDKTFLLEWLKTLASHLGH